MFRPIEHLTVEAKYIPWLAMLLALLVAKACS